MNPNTRFGREWGSTLSSNFLLTRDSNSRPIGWLIWMFFISKEFTIVKLTPHTTKRITSTLNSTVTSDKEDDKKWTFQSFFHSPHSRGASSADVDERSCIRSFNNVRVIGWAKACLRCHCTCLQLAFTSQLRSWKLENIMSMLEMAMGLSAIHVFRKESTSERSHRIPQEEKNTSHILVSSTRPWIPRTTSQPISSSLSDSRSSPTSRYPTFKYASRQTTDLYTHHCVSWVCV